MSWSLEARYLELATEVVLEPTPTFTWQELLIEDAGNKDGEVLLNTLCVVHG